MRVTTINSIELSSKCNYSCEYCPAKEQHKYRKTGYMSIETFKKALKFVKYYAKKDTQKELNLFGVGEPLLNPNVIEIMKLAYECEPKINPIHLNTNGQLVTRELVKEFEKYLNEVDITAHNPKEAITALRLCRNHNFKLGLSLDFMTQPNNWAGQVDWFESDVKYPCPWLDNGQAFIMSDGNISTCCIDAFGRGIIGNVYESKPEELNVTPFELCKTCHQIHE